MAYYRQENCWKCGEYYFTEDEPYTSPIDEHIKARCPKCKYDPDKTRVVLNADGSFTATFYAQVVIPVTIYTFIVQPKD